MPYATFNGSLDLVAVDRLIAGTPAPAPRRDEQAAAALILTDLGASAQDISARIGVANRSVVRWRQGGTMPVRIVNAPSTEWQRAAVCRTEDMDLFFPVGETGPAALQIQQAKAVCQRCPVMLACGEWALTVREESGVWGGLDETERRNILRRRSKGTGSGRKAVA